MDGKTLNRIVNIILLAISTAFALFIVDVLTYFFLVREPIRYGEGLYVADATLGYRLAPNYRGVFRHRAGEMPIRINSHGFRGPEWDLKTTAARVAFVGDSYTFGVPLPFENGFVAKVARKLGTIATFNLGVPGYGAPQILETVRLMCPVIRPTHVFYMYYLNDTSRVEMDPRSRSVFRGHLVNVTGEGGKRLDESDLERNLEASLNESWSLAASLRMLNVRQILSETGIHPRQIIERYGSQELSREYRDRYTSTNKPEFTDEASREAARLVRHMGKASRDCGADFSLVILPSYAEAYYGVVEPATERLLAALGADVNIIDIRRFATRGESLVPWYDGHYSDKGTDLVSGVISAYLLGWRAGRTEPR